MTPSPATPPAGALDRLLSWATDQARTLAGTHRDGEPMCAMCVGNAVRIDEARAELARLREELEQVSGSAEGARSSSVPVNEVTSSGKVPYQRPSQGGNVAALDPATSPHATLDTASASQVPTVDELREFLKRTNFSSRPFELDLHDWLTSRLSKLARAALAEKNKNPRAP